VLCGHADEDVRLESTYKCSVQSPGKIGGTDHQDLRISGDANQQFTDHPVGTVAGQR